jgi:hypothetical protein
MRLLEFYRALFEDATNRFEPVWHMDAGYPWGYRWTKNNYPLPEQFRIFTTGDESPILMFSVVLPNSYAKTNVFDEVYRYPTNNEMTVVIKDREIWVNASLCTSQLEHSVLGFINQARSDMMNIFDCLILKTDIKD